MSTDSEDPTLLDKKLSDHSPTLVHRPHTPNSPPLHKTHLLTPRFTHFLPFPDWAPADCLEALAARAAKENIAVEEAATAVFAEGFGDLVKLDGWGNARDLDKLWKAALQAAPQLAWDSNRTASRRAAAYENYGQTKEPTNLIP